MSILSIDLHSSKSTIRLSFHFQNVTYESLDDIYCSKIFIKLTFFFILFVVSYSQCNVLTGHHCVLGIIWSVISWYLSYHLSFKKKHGGAYLFSLCIYLFIFNHNITRPVFAVKHVHFKYWPSHFNKHDKIVISLSKRHLWITWRHILFKVQYRV
jgi:hypothetical protein